MGAGEQVKGYAYPARRDTLRQHGVDWPLP
jgi:hypothetical protein